MTSTTSTQPPECRIVSDDDLTDASMSCPQHCRPNKRVLCDEAESSTSSLTSRLHSSNTCNKRRRMETGPMPTSSKSSTGRLSPMVVIQGPASASSRTRTDTSIYRNTNPEQLLKSILKSNGYSTASIDSLSLENFFLEMTTDNFSGYDHDMIDAIKTENIQELRSKMRSGENLQCCNRFGESIVHMACRRGSENVLKFLMEEADVSIRLRDDYGRTPAHDACWAQEPAFGVLTILIERCPDLLLMSDKRGHTPLSYARRDHWGSICEFLERNRDLLHLKGLASRTLDS